MKASEAKKKALEQKQILEGNVKTKKSKAFNDDVTLLHNHFMTKVNSAVAKGNLATEPVTFDVGRFTDDVIREVNSKLNDDGFNMQMEKHNAYQKVKFTISWS